MSRGVVELERLIGDLTSDDDGLAEAAVEGLAALGYEALTPLTDLLDSQKTDDRWWAVRALAALDHPAVPRLLLGVITDDSPDVRQAAILGLRLHPSGEAIPALATALEDVDRLTAHLASDALAACGSWAVEGLSHALRSPNASVRIEAARALAEIDDPAVVPQLFHALDDASVSVNFWAERGLERRGIGMTFFSP